MPQLPDGTVLPSFVGVERTPPMSDGLNFDNVRLRVGEVQDVVYPDDHRSVSKKFVEYRVLVQQRSRRTGSGKVYEGCVLNNPFGGIADKLSYTLRADSSQNRNRSGLGRGSKVLLLCVNGETNQAVILGGIRDQTDSDSDSKGKGHHFAATFNGVTAAVNSDGELTLAYGGATGIDGSTTGSNGGTALQLLKSGNAVLGDGGSNVITVDHANNQVTIARGAAFKLGAATDAMLLGQTFRTQQQLMHTTIAPLFQTLQGLVAATGAAILAAGAANVPPIIGGALAAPFFLTASQLLIQIGPILGQIGQAILAFEQAGAPFNNYLSKFNKSD